VVDLSGRAIGVNIARAGRVETYAVPADVVKLLVRELQSGHGATDEQAKPGAATEESAEGTPFVPPAPASNGSPKVGH
jgi:hypothetical protein